MKVYAYIFPPGSSPAVDQHSISCLCAKVRFSFIKVFSPVISGFGSVLRVIISFKVLSFGSLVDALRFLAFLNLDRNRNRNRNRNRKPQIKPQRDRNAVFALRFLAIAVLVAVFCFFEF